MSRDGRQEELNTDAHEAAERRASTSEESPSNVTRSTQDLTIGGSGKYPESRAGARALGQEHRDLSPADEQATPSPGPPEERGNQSADGLSSSDQALENQERALESGEESPG